MATGEGEGARCEEEGECRSGGQWSESEVRRRAMAERLKWGVGDWDPTV